ncbi:class I SAM-dependent methyltransferase [Nonomuraea sp. NPDC052129]|uniref:SAM-dependent methyltransferase n=1 Tax=Nonomuraea sp. NPDC052129 TaxID=3154651 RepID=UPI00341AC31F
MTALAMVAEFDDVAGWTADAVELLGERHAVPAACRGSASPAALAWLAEACELAPGMRLLDVGAGVGGPAAWAAERFGVRPILIEPMPAAGHAAARLFGLPIIAADGREIPLRTATADAAWCLGMLCTVRDKAGVLREIHRVLKPGASLGLSVVVARGPQVLQFAVRLNRLVRELAVGASAAAVFVEYDRTLPGGPRAGLHHSPVDREVWRRGGAGPLPAHQAASGFRSIKANETARMDIGRHSVA